MNIVNKNLVKDILKLRGPTNIAFVNYMKGNQVTGPHKRIESANTSKPLVLLRMDLMGLTRTKGKGGKKYIMVIVDDFSRFTFVDFFKRNLKQ